MPFLRGASQTNYLSVPVGRGLTLAHLQERRLDLQGVRLLHLGDLALLGGAQCRKQQQCHT